MKFEPVYVASIYGFRFARLGLFALSFANDGVCE